MSPQSKAKARTKQKPRTWNAWIVRYKGSAQPWSEAFFERPAAMRAMRELCETNPSCDYWVQRVVITEQPTKARS